MVTFQNNIPNPCFATMSPFNLQAMKQQMEVATVATPQQRWAPVVGAEAKENTGMAGPDDATIPAVLDGMISPHIPPENIVSCHSSGGSMKCETCHIYNIFGI